jgi:glycosyltransferase involved in cell wall biosynthesis
MTTPNLALEERADRAGNIPSESRQNQNIIVFELAYGGHYASYIRYLAEYWCQQELLGCLYFVVSPTFIQQHPDVIDLASNYPQQNLKFVAIAPEEEADLVPRKNSFDRAIRSFQEWNLLRKYARELAANHCLLLYFDSFQAAVASGANLDCSFSGIYFRPTFHYPTFADYAPSRKDRLQHIREKSIILPRVMRHPRLKNLFCLDPFAIEHFERFHSSVNPIHLPDPVPIKDISEPKQLEQFKHNLGIEPNRKVFLFFGALYDGRKGIKQVLEAISSLPFDLCQQICLLLAGQMFANNDSPILKHIKELSESLPVQIILRDEFIPEEDVHLYFQSADVILAPYLYHVGMSGTLVQAAAAEKPILASNYGLMGEITRRWELGLTVDSTNPSQIAEKITQFLEVGVDKIGDRAKMKDFARQNSSQNFAQTIFQNLFITA